MIVDLFKNFQPMGYLQTFHTLLRMKWNIRMEKETYLVCKRWYRGTTWVKLRGFSYRWFSSYWKCFCHSTKSTKVYIKGITCTRCRSTIAQIPLSNEIIDDFFSLLDTLQWYFPCYFLIEMMIWDKLIRENWIPINTFNF